MYRLLIVDDEPNITDGLYDFFLNSDQLDLDVYKAYSPVQALALAKEMKIDIVLSDIRMPVMNGFELQKQIALLWPHCKVVFLSGFGEPDNVQQALRNDAVDFVIKTESVHVILSAVTKALDKLIAELKDKQLIEQAKKNIDMALPLLQNKLLTEMLEGISISDSERKRQFENLKISLDPNRSVALLLGRMDIHSDFTNSMNNMQIIYGIQNIINEQLSKLNIFSIPYDQKKIVWMFTPKEEDSVELWDEILIYTSEMLDSIQYSCKELYGVTISFVFYKKAVPWQSIAEQFYNYRLALSNCYLLESGILLLDDNTISQPENTKQETVLKNEYLIRSELKKIPQLEMFFESGQKEEFMVAFQKFIEVAASCRSIPYNTLMEVYYTIAMFFLAYMNKLKIRDKIGEAFNLDNLMLMEKHSSWSEAMNYFIKLAEFLFEFIRKDSSSETNRIIRSIAAYVEENLHSDLSVNKIADVLHFSPSYLSRLYKQMTDKGLKEYVSEVKLQKAREMLEKSDMKIHEVSSALGFYNPSHFNRFFKQYTNLNPQEYRDKF